MSNPELEQPGNENGEILDAPNKQAVGLDPPWVEGSGGGQEPKTAAAAATGAGGLDEMTKEELLDHATELGVSPANKNMTKEELRAGIDAKLAEERG